MEAIVEDLSQSKKLIRFSVPHQRVADALEAALGQVRKSASVKGFRPGHVPERILRARFGDEIRKEALGRLVPQALREAVLENKLRPVGEPQVSDLKWEDQEPLTFTATIEVLPDFDLPTYKGVRVVAHKIEPPSDSEVEELLQSYRESRASLVPVEGRPVQMGDSIVVTLEQTVDGKTETMKDLPLEVAEGLLLPGLAGALVGIERDGTKRFELAIPDDYHDKAIAGKTIGCVATVSEIKEKHLPELTDEFAKEVGGADSVDALRERVRGMINRQRDADERRRQEGVVLDTLVDGADFEVPESLLKMQTERNIARTYQRAAYSGVPREKVVERHDEIVKNASVASARQIKLTLLLERIAEVEKIRVTDEDVDAFFDQAATARGATSEQVRAAYEAQEGALDAVRDELLENKVRSFLMAQAEVG